MKIVVYGAGVMAQHVKESILNTGNEFVGFVDPLGNGDFVTLKNSDIEYEGIIDFSHFSLLEEVLESDIEIIEKHHNRKIDAPSGTANTLLEVINSNLDEKYDVVYGREGHSKRTEKEIGVHSIRGGNIIGEHSVIFAKNDEIIEIKHEALSRKIFSDGSVKAIGYLKDKKPGMYTMKDVLGIK